MNDRRLIARVSILFGCLAGAAASLLADGITIRVTPPNKAQFLQYQRFDFRVGASAADASATITSLSITLDGKDITSIGVGDSPSSNVRNWTYRGGYLGIPGFRTIAATATGTSGATALTGSGSNVITI